MLLECGDLVLDLNFFLNPNVFALLMFQNKLVFYFILPVWQRYKVLKPNPFTV